MSDVVITIKKLPEDRWEEYRALRLEALKNEPLAYSSSYEEEQAYPEESWRDGIKNMLFVMADNRPVGMAGVARNPHLKTNHVGEMFGVYLREEYRGRGAGRMLIAAVLQEIQSFKGVKKINVGVNPTQKAALHLYRKYGFKTSARFKNWMCIDGKYYDALIMEKPL